MARERGGRRGDEWHEEWGGRRGRVLDAPLLVLEINAEILRFAQDDGGEGELGKKLGFGG